MSLVLDGYLIQGPPGRHHGEPNSVFHGHFLRLRVLDGYLMGGAERLAGPCLMTEETAL